MLQAQQIKKSYDNLQVLKGIDLVIGRGEVVSLVGASGAGKSTLLQVLGTLDKPDSGKVLFDEIDPNALKEKELARFRNEKIGFVFQFHNLMAEFTALENVCMPAFIGQKEEKVTRERATMLLEMLGLKDRMTHFPAQMSGGEQQRVAVARALVNQPLLVFADEPSGNLDSKNAHELHDLFFELRDKLGQSFLIVTHNEELARMADRRLVIQDGVLLP
jgi:lipoprotein-releasing system ATP-binding protein